MEVETLKAELEVLTALADEQEQRVRYYQRRASVLTMSYLMWQRLFYFAVSHASSALQCVHWRVVLRLSLSCSLVYLLHFLEALIMLYRTHNRLDMICGEHASICQRILVAMNQDNGGSSMEARASSNFQVRALNYDSFSAMEMKVYVCAMAFALLAVTAFELYACIYLLCP